MTLKTPPNAQKNWERRAEMMRAEVELREKLERENGLVGHPKAGKLWQLAWQWGHAYGDNDVKDYYDDMAELLK